MNNTIKLKEIEQILNNLEIIHNNNKVIMVSLNKGYHIKDIETDLSLKEIKGFTIKILNLLSNIKDYEKLRFIVENKGICPFCLSLDLKGTPTEDDKLILECLKCGGEF